MLLEEMRQKVVDYGNQLISSGLTIGTAGNISMYDPETGYMVISPIYGIDQPIWYSLRKNNSRRCCRYGSAGQYCGQQTHTFQ